MKTTSIRSEDTPSISLKNEEGIVRLANPINHYYKQLSELKAPPGQKIFTALYIGTGQACVVRVIPMAQRMNRSKFKAQLFDRMKVLDHPNILRLYEILQDANHLYFVSEIYDGGDFEEFVLREGPLSERRAATAIRQLLSALAFSHSLGTIHGHISHNSVFVKSDPGLGIINIKAGGFEADMLSDKKDSREESAFRDPAAELGTATEKSDIYACGVLLVYLLTGALYWPKSRIPGVFQSLPLQSPLWVSLNPLITPLVTSMLNKCPDSRPTALACLTNPWIQKLAFIRPITTKSTRSFLGHLIDNGTPVALKKALLRFIVNRIMKDSEIAKLGEVFQLLDTTGDGVISEDELLNGLKKLMPEEKATKEAKRVMQKVDKNANGRMEYSEFLVNSFSSHQLLTDDNLRTLFTILDADNSGSISIAELRRFFALNSSRNIEEEWKRLVMEFDTSGDGVIDFKEFQALMLKALEG